MRNARFKRASAAVVAALGLALLPAAHAAAHVTVSSPDAAPGGFGKLVFRVPSESSTANTTALTIELPTDTPFRFVNVGAVPGWTAELVTEELPEPVEQDGFTLTEAVTRVTWTADGDGLRPHEFTEFELSVGPFPEGVDQLMFPATQTYSDGEVVAWADPPNEDGSEPEHPAPVLALTAGGDTDPTADGAAGTPASDDDASDGLARGLGIAGLVLGAAALVVALLGRRTRGAPA